MLNLDPNNLGFMHRMVNEERGIQKSRSFNFRRMFDGTGRHTNSVVPENENGGKDTIDDNKLQIRSQAPKPPVIDIPPIANVLNRPDDKGPAPKVNDGGKSGVPVLRSVLYLQGKEVILFCNLHKVCVSINCNYITYFSRETLV